MVYIECEIPDLVESESDSDEPAYTPDMMGNIRILQPARILQPTLCTRILQPARFARTIEIHKPTFRSRVVGNQRLIDCIDGNNRVSTLRLYRRHQHALGVERD